ncbi:DUF998 domain-containing protein [Streptomyces sp. SID13031]|uniref:DUF998 domain-containing protein n=1 Tax=Streptomyces sp. SID13031 TaxID=2706046 RepID=UPI0013CB930E|nr:DUF998 domain-containing protein [Streptomyces sp. SID13031]NEA35744.1 DUF998 domain-containing protein [Streptomyces sp. SID13031]
MADASSTTSIARTAGACALIVAAIQYVVLEAVTAAAWDNPTYSYAHNNISDLGVPSCGGKVDGRVICSPLHTVMNTGFIVQGVLFALAALLLFRLLPGPRQWIYPVLAVVHGIGFTLVGLFHGSPEAGMDGSMAVHIFGAALLILGGNAAAIVVGRQLLNTHKRLGLTGITLGALGLLSLVVMGATSGHQISSTFERGSVYTFIAAQLVAGIALLARHRSATPVATNPTPARAGG